jgi:aspartate/methionine/tyrosine aminotransferase
MRSPIVCDNVELMRYGIREIVDVAQQLKALDPGLQIMGENIGDPVAKGWDVPAFVKEILTDLIRSPGGQVFAYTHSRGRIETRQWVVEYARRFSPASRLNYEQVVFVNGLGAGISVIYRLLAPGARVIQPQPAYPTHISGERFHAAAETIAYRLDPRHEWQPDLEHLESQVQRHPEVAGILLINPNNPTGAVYPRATLEKILQLAERHRLMLISDEVYFRMVFNGARYVQLTELAGDRVPLLVMRGLSKDVPWPGARCGWLEFHNVERDPDFAAYFEAIKKAVMLEVCSTSLPQAALPLIYDHPEFDAWLAKYCSLLEANSNAIHAILSRVPGIRVNPIQGAFYMTILFEDGVLNDRQTLPIANAPAADFIRRLTANPRLPLDKRFAYYLLAATGICVVPAGDFDSPWPGFRVTTLERDPARRDQTYQRLAEALGRYLGA